MRIDRLALFALPVAFGLHSSVGCGGSDSSGNTSLAGGSGGANLDAGDASATGGTSGKGGSGGHAGASASAGHAGGGGAAGAAGHGGAAGQSGAGAGGVAGQGGTGGASGASGKAGAAGIAGSSGTGGSGVGGSAGSAGQSGTGGSAGDPCGNGKIDPGETCDPPSSCPVYCDDSDACTIDIGFGSPTFCTAGCDHQAITSCIDNDGCCPAVCNNNNDVDCPHLCNNGVIEVGEQCDQLELAGATCMSQGFLSGTLACSVSCIFDTSNCVPWQPLGVLPSGFTVTHLWGRSPTDLWVVGFGGTAYHFDGTNWNAASTSAPSNRYLYSVWGVGAQETWAVGEIGMVVHTPDGTSWAQQPTGLLRHVVDLWGATNNDVWAVAHYGNILHYNGLTWTNQSTTTGYDFEAIWGTGPQDLWAVGGWAAQVGINFDSSSIIFRNTGSGWVDVTPQGAAWLADDIWLTDVFMLDSTHGWAIGSYPEGDPILGTNDVVRFWNGTAWTTAYKGIGCNLRTVWAASPSKVFAGGAMCSLRFDGTSWSKWGPKGASSAWGFPPDKLFVAAQGQVVQGTL